jgi:hypothetical protein
MCWIVGVVWEKQVHLLRFLVYLCVLLLVGSLRVNVPGFGFLFLLYCRGLLCFFGNRRSSGVVMLVDNVLERWCGVVEAGPFAMVEGEWNLLVHHVTSRFQKFNRHFITD